MSDSDFRKSVVAYLKGREESHGKQKYIAHLKGNSATSVAAQRQQFLTLFEKEDGSLLMSRCRLGGNGALGSMQDYPIDFHTIINISHDGNAYTITLSSIRHTPLPWVSDGPESLAKAFFRTLHSTLMGREQLRDKTPALWQQMVAFKVVDAVQTPAIKAAPSAPVVKPSAKSVPGAPPTYASTARVGSVAEKRTTPGTPQSVATSDLGLPESPSADATPSSDPWGTDPVQEDWSQESTSSPVDWGIPSPKISKIDPKLKIDPKPKHKLSSASTPSGTRSNVSLPESTPYPDHPRQPSIVEFFEQRYKSATAAVPPSAATARKEAPPTSRDEMSGTPSSALADGLGTSRPQSVAVDPDVEEEEEDMYAMPTPQDATSSPSLTYQEKKAAESSLIDTAKHRHEGSKRHELKNAPLLSYDASELLKNDEAPKQYGIMGAIQSIRFMSSSETPEDRRLYLNTNAPFSAMVCGVQGSGKSHTVSVMLENMLIANHAPLGSLLRPLSGLVLHFGEGGPSAQPCEAAWVGVPALSGVRPPEVRVYVSPSSINTMRKVYKRLGPHVQVEPLSFRETELDAEAILSMMAIGSSESAPLYVHVILSILRELGDNYTWSRFQAKLETKKKTLNPAQLAVLEQRLSLLHSFMEKSGGQRRDLAPRFAAGQLTIVDLSDPFIDPSSACGLFEIVTRLFKRTDIETGKVLVVDEAHKYLSTQTGSSSLTQTLLSAIRQMRHSALRVIVSTQEPTVLPPVLLDLCSILIVHRIQSPSWWDHLKSHVSAECGNEAFDKVVQLNTGQAIVFAPTALVVSLNGDGEMMLDKLDRRYLLIKTRQRVTKDGGTSVLVVDTET